MFVRQEIWVVSSFSWLKSMSVNGFIKHETVELCKQRGGEMCSRCVNASLFCSIYRIHWGGAETAMQWCGYMSGLVQAGQQAAREVLAELCPTALIQEDLEALKLGQDTFSPAWQTHPNSRICLQARSCSWSHRPSVLLSFWNGTTFYHRII